MLSAVSEFTCIHFAFPKHDCAPPMPCVHKSSKAGADGSRVGGCGAIVPVLYGSECEGHRCAA